MDLTPLARPFFNGRLKAIAKYATDSETIQRNVLKHLLNEASATRWGIEHHYSAIHSYEQFAAAVGIQDYESINSDIKTMQQLENEVRGEQIFRVFLN